MKKFKVTELGDILCVTRQQVRNWITIGILGSRGGAVRLKAEKICNEEGRVLTYYITEKAVNEFMTEYEKTLPTYKWKNYKG